MTAEERIAEIDREIAKVMASGKNDYATVQSLAILYGAKQAINNFCGQTDSQNSDAISELQDILPSLRGYMTAKEECRSGRLTQTAVIHELEKLVVEINEFIVALKAQAADDSELDILKSINV